MRVALLGCALAVAAAAAATAAELLLVYSVGRHGARNVLPKTDLLQESDANGGPTLLPQGQRQAYSAGLAYRARYLSADCTAANATCLSLPVTSQGACVCAYSRRSLHPSLPSPPCTHPCSCLSTRKAAPTTAQAPCTAPWAPPPAPSTTTTRSCAPLPWTAPS